MVSLGEVMGKLAKFRSDERGAVTVDYIALTAVLIATAVALTTTIGDGIVGSTTTMIDELKAQVNCDQSGDDNTGGSSSSTFGNSC